MKAWLRGQMCNTRGDKFKAGLLELGVRPVVMHYIYRAVVRWDKPDELVPDFVSWIEDVGDNRITYHQYDGLGPRRWAELQKAVVLYQMRQSLNSMRYAYWLTPMWEIPING